MAPPWSVHSPFAHVVKPLFNLLFFFVLSGWQMLEAILALPNLQVLFVSVLCRFFSLSIYPLSYISLTPRGPFSYDVLAILPLTILRKSPSHFNLCILAKEKMIKSPYNLYNSWFFLLSLILYHCPVLALWYVWGYNFQICPPTVNYFHLLSIHQRRRSLKAGSMFCRGQSLFYGFPNFISIAWKWQSMHNSQKKFFF